MAATAADAILLHIGTNNLLDESEDAAEVSDILDEIFGVNSNATVVLALIINARTDFSRRDDISTYNSNLSTMAQERLAAGDDLIIVDMENGAGLDYTSADMADTTLAPSAWTNAGSVLPLGGTTNWIDPAGTGNSTFCRLVIP